MRKTDRMPMGRILAAALALAPLLAGAAAGEFSFVTGEVTLTKPNGQSRPSTPNAASPKAASTCAYQSSTIEKSVPIAQ